MVPEFTYEGVDKAGKRINGKLDAPNEGEVRMILRAQGVRPSKVLRASVLQSDIGGMLTQRGSKADRTSVITFTRQLQVLVSSGVPLMQALEILLEQFQSQAALRNIITSLREKVSAGKFLWEGLSAYPMTFSKIYIALVRAGESSGSLDIVLKRLSRYLEDQDRIIKMVKGAMMYPIIVTVIGFGVIFAMIAFVVPKFEAMLKGTGGRLPAMTQILIDISAFIWGNLYSVLGVLAAATYLIPRYASSPEGRAFIQRINITIPFVSDLVIKSTVSRFCRTLQILLAAGITLIDAVEIARNSLDHVAFESATSRMRNEIESGKTLGQTISKIPLFPKMVSQMIAVGESTGNLEQMLDRVSDFYEVEVEESVKGLSKLIEPIVLVVLGGMVLGILIAMYLPVFSIVGDVTGSGS